MTRDRRWDRQARGLVDGLDVIGEQVVVGPAAKLVLVHGRGECLDAWKKLRLMNKDAKVWMSLYNVGVEHWAVQRRNACNPRS